MLLPWLPWLGKALAGIREDWQNPVRRFLWLWSGFVIAFFSLSGTKLPHYALYGCTPLFILIASRHNSLRSPLAGLPLLVLLGLFAAVPAILPQLTVRDAFYAAQLARFGDAVQPPGGIWPGVAVVVIATLAIIAWPVRLWQRIALGALLGNLLMSFWLAPLLGELLQGPVKRSGEIARKLGEPVVQWNAHWPSFSVYLQAETAIREPKPGELAITRSDRLPKDAQVEVLRKEGGVMLVRQK